MSTREVFALSNSDLVPGKYEGLHNILLHVAFFILPYCFGDYLLFAFQLIMEGRRSKIMGGFA